MLEKRKVAVMHGINDITVEELPIPELINDGDVLVKVRSVGICGSDIHFYKDGRIGAMVLEYPHVLGHECAGEVVKVGTAVNNLKIGDRVAVEPGRPCLKCEFCQKGKYNLCPDMEFMSAPTEGAFTEYTVRPAHFCFKLPDNVSYDEGAMCEPLAVALQALKQGQVCGGKSVAIMGCGPIALTTLLACKAYGCTNIYMTDVVDYRLKKAEELGATKAINSAKVDATQEIKALTNGCGVDVVFDATGLDVVYRMVTDIVVRGGFIVLVGMGPKEYSEINIAAIRDNENSLVGVFRYNNVYKQAIDLIAKGLVDMTQIISHNVGLDDIVEAMVMVHDKKDGAIKVVINM